MLVYSGEQREQHQLQGFDALLIPELTVLAINLE